MKIAVSGKGGVGKTTLAALLASQFAKESYSVLAVDADPDANLAGALGFPHPEDIIPISAMKELIEERTGAKPGQSGSIFKLNPKVDDIPEKYTQNKNGIRLMVMGRIKRGGSGCYCPENSLLQALMSHLLLARNEVVILDMEAGIEHLGRATAKAVDKLIVVIEPGRRSIETAMTIDKMAKDIGLSNITLVGNKIRSQSDIDILKSNLPSFEFLGFMSYDQSIIDVDLANLSISNTNQSTIDEAKSIYQSLLSSINK